MSVLDELIENPSIYSQIIGVNREDMDSGLEGKLTELARVQGVPSYLLLLYLMKRSAQLEIDDRMLTRIVELLALSFVRRNVTDTPPTCDLERLFISICEGIEDDGLKGIEAARYLRERLVDISASDAVFKERLAGPICEVNPNMTRFILTVLAEPSVTKEMKGLWERYPSGNYVWTVEHVFPQGENIPSDWVDVIGSGDHEEA